MNYENCLSWMIIVALKCRSNWKKCIPLIVLLVITDPSVQYNNKSRIIFLYSTDIFGISDHHLLFTKEEVATEEELSAASEMGEVIQAKVG